MCHSQKYHQKGSPSFRTESRLWLTVQRQQSCDYEATPTSETMRFYVYLGTTRVGAPGNMQITT